MKDKLRKLFSKGSKYCEPSGIDYNQARENIANGIEDCIPVWQA